MLVSDLLIFVCVFMPSKCVIWVRFLGM